MNAPKPGRRITHAAIYQLGSEPPDDLSAVTTAEERIAMMWPLALTAWTVSGWVLPVYRRDEMPCRVILRGNAPRTTE